VEEWRSICLLSHISPEVRYTRWASTAFVDLGDVVHESQDQAEFLVGVTF
jgi:hypothetical protein